MITLSPTSTMRWAPIDGGVAMETSDTSVTCGDVTETATVAGDRATLTAAQVVELCPAIGVHTLAWGGTDVQIERVGGRYAVAKDVIAYGNDNNDGFERFPADAITACIQQAEEAIESGTSRSFTRRAIAVAIPSGAFVELPVEDAVSISAGTLVGDRQARNDTDTDIVATVTYGATSDLSIHRACVQLAASYLRPRVGAENARGTSIDGVYVSYELATGTDGSWTGIPYVDSVIEAHRSHRRYMA